jgi:hypothetical protein
VAVTLNQRGYENARKLLADGKYVWDERDDWSEHRPSAQQENEFIDRHGIDAYGRWFLGVDDEDHAPKGRFRYPYGDFEKVHRCGVLAAEVRAGQRKHQDIETAAAHLHGELDGLGPTGG